MNVNEERQDDYLDGLDAQDDPQPTPLEAWLMNRPLVNRDALTTWRREWRIYYVTHEHPVTFREFLAALRVERWRRVMNESRRRDEEIIKLIAERGW